MAQQRLSQEEIAGKIDDAFDSVENFRSGGLERVKLFQAVKNKALEKEKKRLSAKLGDDHPRVKRVATRLQYNQGLFKDLDVEIEKTKITVPSVDKDSWMLHGRVLKQDRKGVPGLTVGLYDENGKWIEKLGYGCTDKRGYFSILYSKKEEEPKENSRLRKLFIYISDKNQKILCKDDESLYIGIGQIDYREIHLSDEEICSPPDPDPADKPVKPSTWIVKGRVSDKDDNAISGLTVSLYDKDHKFDHLLGITHTDEAGNFMFGYKTEEFPELFEAAPYIFLMVSNQAGKRLYISKKRIKCEAGRIESFDIKIKKAIG